MGKSERRPIAMSVLHVNDGYVLHLQEERNQLDVMKFQREIFQKTPDEHIIILQPLIDHRVGTFTNGIANRLFNTFASNYRGDKKLWEFDGIGATEHIIGNRDGIDWLGEVPRKGEEALVNEALSRMQGPVVFQICGTRKNLFGMHGEGVINEGIVLGYDHENQVIVFMKDLKMLGDELRIRKMTDVWNDYEAYSQGENAEFTMDHVTCYSSQQEEVNSDILQFPTAA